MNILEHIFLWNLYSFLLGVNLEWIFCWIKFLLFGVFTNDMWLPTLYIVSLVILDTLISVLQYLIVVLICTPLLPNDAEYIIMYFLAI